MARIILTFMMQQKQRKQKSLHYYLSSIIDGKAEFSAKGKEKEKEDRKDERTKIQASQQSELIDQRKNEKPPKNFESAGNDILDGQFGLGAFDPR